MGAYDPTTQVADDIDDNLAQYHNELKTAVDHLMTASAYAAYTRTQSMTGNVTLTDSDFPIQSFSPTAARDLLMPAVATTNHVFFVANRSATYEITVKNSGGTAIGTIAVSSSAVIFSDGANAWFVLISGIEEETADMTGGRLTLESGVPVSTSDQNSKTTLYYTPYTSDRITLYDGVSWKIYVFTEIYAFLNGKTANKNYDVFCYLSSGAPTLELVAWTSDSARATAVVYTDGKLVKSGDATRRYLGTIRINPSGGQCEDAALSRFVWNMYNRIPRALQVTGTTSHTNTNTAVTYWNSDSTLKFEYVIGIQEDHIFVTLLNDMTCAATSSTSQGCIGLGINTASGLTGASYWASAFKGRSSNNTTGIPALGYNYIALLERGLTGCTFAVAQASMLLNG